MQQTYKDKVYTFDGKYYVRGKNRLHVVVYKSECSEIPEHIGRKYHIHHKDFNVHNNSIDNLVCLSPKEHRQIHYERSMKDPEFVRMLMDNMDRIRPLTKKWHGSEDGRKWHSEHAKESIMKSFIERDYVCSICNKEFKSKVPKKDHAKFCSNKCKSKHRRNLGLDNEFRDCLNCGKEFLTNKYLKQKFCSRDCGIFYRFYKK